MKPPQNFAAAEILKLRAENAALKARIAELEAGDKPKPQIIDVGTPKPAPLHGMISRYPKGDKAVLRDREMREAVKKAEKRVWAAWDKFNKPVAKDYAQSRAQSRQLDNALATARAAAREDLRARWAREDADVAAAMVDLPPHITRMNPGAKQ